MFKKGDARRIASIHRRRKSSSSPLATAAFFLRRRGLLQCFRRGIVVRSLRQKNTNARPDTDFHAENRSISRPIRGSKPPPLRMVKKRAGRKGPGPKLEESRFQFARLERIVADANAED
jgi:hypothetical protein